MRLLARLQPYALLLLRLVLGFTMVYHSWDKVMPSDGLLHAYRHHTLLSAFEHFNQFVATLGIPRWLGYVSTTTEFLGGLCLVLGWLTRFWAFLVTINMLVALAAVNLRQGYSGSEYSMALATMACLLVTTGSGALSLDRRFGVA